MASKDNDVERDTKRLRSSDPDLKVVLGTGEGESIQWYHSQTLASKSRYIDTMLSTPMRESAEHTITFPDITLGTWEKLMRFLDSPVAARHMNANDVLDLALIYDKYEFLEGRKLCDEVLVDYFKKSIGIEEKKFMLDLDFVIGLVNVAHQASLKSAFREIIQYVWKKLRSAAVPYGRMMFTEDHLKTLVPLLKFSIENRKSLGLDANTCSESSLITTHTIEVGLEDPDFPQKFISECQNGEERHLLSRCISHIELIGSRCNADGSFYSDINGWGSYRPDPEEDGRTSMWGRHEVSFEIEHLSEDQGFEGWAIVRWWTTEVYDDGEPNWETMVRKKCWIAPCSKNRKLPPLQGWIPADPAAYGNPKLKYILRRSIDVENSRLND